MYKEGDDSIAQSEGKSYRVDDLIALTEKLKPESIPVRRLSWIMLYTEVDRDRINQANLKVPVIVVQDEKKRYVTLDGAHRLAKAMELGATSLPCYLLKAKDLAGIELTLGAESLLPCFRW